MRRARVVLSVTCYSKATGVTAGERSETETVTLRLERGDWKRAVAKWYLASRLLNLGYPFQNQEVNSHAGNLNSTYLICRLPRKRTGRTIINALF
jgi:hypothetical protein